MNINIRTANPTTDYDVVAELLNMVQAEVVTADEIRLWDSRTPVGMIRERFVAVADDEIVGYCGVARSNWMPKHHCRLYAVTAPTARDQGIGTKMLDFVTQVAQQKYGATVVGCEINELDMITHGFLESRGYTVADHTFTSTIALATFDSTPFQDYVAQAEASGIRFSTLEAEGLTDNLRRYYELFMAVDGDVPSAMGFHLTPYDDFVGSLQQDPLFNPAHVALAIDGTAWVGLAAMYYQDTTNAFYNELTGVVASHRGRKIAQALKLLSIQKAQAANASYIYTQNHASNGPMLAINRKFGYTPERGNYLMERTL